MPLTDADFLENDIDCCLADFHAGRVSAGMLYDMLMWLGLINCEIVIRLDEAINHGGDNEFGDCQAQRASARQEDERVA